MVLTHSLRESKNAPLCSICHIFFLPTVCMIGTSFIILNLPDLVLRFSFAFCVCFNSICNFMM